jgi:cytochrome P450
MGPVLLAMDGEQHKSRRLLISHAFRTSQLEKWENSLVRPAITGLCDAVVEQGKAELIGDVISRFPVLVISGMCGVPSKDSSKFLRWAKEIHRGMVDPVVGHAAADAMRAYLEPIVEERKLKPGDDLISDIIHAKIDGVGLDEEEIYGFLRLLLPAGTESTFRATGNALMAILTTPGLYDRVQADRSLLGAVAEEAVRWDVSNSMVSRMTTEDTVLGGCPIPKGAAVLAITNSANRDGNRFEHADDFDPDRENKRHLGFGMGAHQCLGQPLARIEMRVGLDVMLSKFKNLRLDPSYPRPMVQGASFRGPDALHVLFD